MTLKDLRIRKPIARTLRLAKQRWNPTDKAISQPLARPLRLEMRQEVSSRQRSTSARHSDCEFPSDTRFDDRDRCGRSGRAVRNRSRRLPSHTLRGGRLASSVTAGSLLWKNRAMATVRATPTCWISDDFPGFVELALTDANGVRHTIHEKVPVLGEQELNSSTAYPREIWIEAAVLSEDQGVVTVHLAHSVESVDGRSDFDIPQRSVRPGGEPN